jgi:hypothetical protein
MIERILGDIAAFRAGTRFHDAAAESRRGAR